MIAENDDGEIGGTRLLKRLLTGCRAGERKTFVAQACLKNPEAFRTVVHDQNL
nr:hypothetical protein [Limnoglobus roseus]